MLNDSCAGYQVVKRGWGGLKTQIVSSPQYVPSFFFHTLFTNRLRVYVYQYHTRRQL